LAQRKLRNTWHFVGVSLFMRIVIVAATAATLTAAALGLPAIAAAVPSGTSSAADTVNSLEEDGHTVAINGAATSPLSECMVTGVHPGSTVYVDIVCPSTG
jgi:hypothetical protein